MFHRLNRKLKGISMNYKTIIKSVILYGGYLFHRNRNSKVIYYHDIGVKYTNMGTSIELIQRHINQIRKCGFEIVKSINSRDNQIMICFDDGWSGLYDYKDFFLKEGIFPTIFVAVDLIGTEYHMTIEQIKELSSLGFLFQTHSWSHEDLTTFDSIQLKHELVDSKAKLENMLSMRFDAICFPKGRFSSEVVKESLNAGYKLLYSSISGAYYDRFNDSIICRNLVQDLSPRGLKYLIKGRSWFLTYRNIKQHFKTY